MTSSSSTTSTRPSPCVTGVRLPGRAAITLADRARVLQNLVTGTLAEAQRASAPQGHPCACPHSSGDRATASGAVCAGSNPAGGAAQSLFFEYILVGPCPHGQLRRDSMNRPSTRHFMTRCHGTRPPNRLHANLFARDLRERIPSQRGELPGGPASRAA